MSTIISPERKASYYVGMAVGVVGFLMFLSPFVAIIGGTERSNPGMTNCQLNGVPVPCSDLPIGPRMPQSGGPVGAPDFGVIFTSFGTAFVGFLLIIVSRFLTRVGQAGLAGSGVILDPEGARQDLQPWNEAKGRMINDAVSQIDVVKNIAAHEEAEMVVKIRCSACHGLNDESQAFCGHCGAKL